MIFAGSSAGQPGCHEVSSLPARVANVANWSRRLVTRAIWSYGRRYLREFHERARRSAETQQRNLARILQRSAGSAFLRDHGLRGDETPEAFRRALPVADYTAFEPYVKRALQGETEALFRRGTRILMFAMTSGTTGRPKYLPVTSVAWQEYKLSWLVWGLAVSETHAGLPFSPILTLASSWRTETAPSGVPCGAISGFLASRVQGRLPTTRHACPPEVALIEDAARRQLVTAVCALAHRDLLMITTANPSTLLSFARGMDMRKDEVLRGVHDGITGLARGNPALARELEAAAARTGHLYPSAAWPALRVLGVWTGGSLQPYLSMLGQYYGDVALRDHGLSASDGHVTIPLEDGSDGGVLNVGGGFYEFIPEGEGSDRTLLPHELEVGKRYFVVLTTSGGLFRYDIRDLVQCTGFFGTAPVLRFLNKGSDIASVTGEKLTSHQVALAAVTVGQKLGAALTEFVLAPVWSDPPHYVLLVERAQLARIDGKALASAFDATLMASNMEYRGKRESGRLGPLRVEAARDGAWRELRERRLAAGATAEQYKHPFLVTDLGFAAAQREAS
jgi:hypothetical protein